MKSAKQYLAEGPYTLSFKRTGNVAQPVEVVLEKPMIAGISASAMKAAVAEVLGEEKLTIDRYHHIKDPGMGSDFIILSQPDDIHAVLAFATRHRTDTKPLTIHLHVDSNLFQADQPYDRDPSLTLTDIPKPELQQLLQQMGLIGGARVNNATRSQSERLKDADSDISPISHFRLRAETGKVEHQGEESLIRWMKRQQRLASIPQDRSA